ncbi:MAG: SDR family oxidoreductase [Hydrogenophaga sp.]|uniref:SDR family NAD(P)-dependent oxidoreductase n=1 Tax=Hydrogenophaga sp. TaxID=1904254 RepID=UPI0026176422|nr:SDR family oxidoreductase [Hydrogenophaga sp.]MCV0438911.1 SDR family oxidoreductase [Hydrogenophaga sp.]
MRLQGKLAVITGAASGIGRSGSLLFAEHGAHVVAIDRDQQALDALKTEAAMQGLTIEVLQVDLSNAQACRQALQQSVGLLGGLHIFWGNAGVVGPAGIEQLDEKAYASAMDLNLTANVLMAGMAITQMKHSGGGSMIFTSSISGLVGSRKSPVYAITKHALVGMARSLAIAHGPDGIRVNAICPGLTETAMLPHAMGRGVDTEAMERNRAAHIASIPMGRVADAIEIAKAALWLASDDASYVTGVALPVDGGFTCA